MPQPDTQRRPDGPSLRAPTARWTPGRVPACLLAIGLAMGVLALPHRAVGQEQATFEVTLEPARATVGDHLTLTIVARHPPETRLEGPGDFAPLELIEARPPLTRDVGSGLQETRLVYVLAAFQTGELQPPPLRVAAAGPQEIVTTLEAPSVTVESVLPGRPELRDLKEPLTAGTGVPSWVWAALLMAGFVGLTAVTMALVRLPLARRPPPLVESEVAPDQGAHRALDAIAGSGLLDRGELEEYYRRLASCLRTYLGRRFDTDAPAMTPQELERRLEALEVGRWPARLAVNLLEQCEAVQFARYVPARERAEADLSAAYQVVALTSEGQSEQVPGPGTPVQQ